MNELVDWFGKDFKIRKEFEDEMLIDVKCNQEAMRFWALQYGPYVEVLEPAELREEIKESVKGMWEKYNENMKDENVMSLCREIFVTKNGRDRI